MDHDSASAIKVVVSLQEIEFLSLDDLGNDQEREFLLDCVRVQAGAGQPGAPGKPWTTPKREAPSIGLDFGSATEVFNSLQHGVQLEQEQPQQHHGQQQQHIALPPYMTGIPLPCSTAQHIHINNFTANLNFPPAGHHPPAPPPVTGQGAAPLPTQPLPFTVGYPSSGPYVAPFPQPSPPPQAGVYPGHFMVYQPPLHVSMYPQYPDQHVPISKEQVVKEATANITFGSTPVVSVRHSSSEDEQEVESSHRAHVQTSVKRNIVNTPLAPAQPVYNNIVKETPSFTVQETPAPVSPPQPVIKEEPPVQHVPEPVQPVNNDKPQHVEEAVSVDVDGNNKSWASLFSPGPGAILHPPSNTDKPTARIQPFTPAPVGESVRKEDQDLSQYLRSYVLQHIAPAFLPRGLTNRSNWCFVNAILQALLACPPFYNMMKNLPIGPRLGSEKSPTPMIDSIVEFVKEMQPLEAMSKNQKKDKARKKEDLPTGNTLEPSYVYKTLLQLESETFKVIEGRQEDAEEFLTCLLNMISDEMVGLLKLTQETHEDSEEQAGAGEGEAGAAGGDWKEVSGGKGKSQVTRRVLDQNTLVTPLQKLALGLCRYSVKAGSNETSSTLQPFYTLQLDIQNDTIKSVDDALRENFSSEQLDGYICSKTKVEVEASRTLSLEELPPILILHLKRFVYSGSSVGCQKVMKHVEFSADLEINRDVLSGVSRSKYTTRQRQYKLFAVVYHNGRESTKGHYVADVYHTGYASWLHCDDSIIQPTAEQLVTSQQHNSTPYILFYRRGDTMVGVEKTVK